MCERLTLFVGLTQVSRPDVAVAVVTIAHHVGRSVCVQNCVTTKVECSEVIQRRGAENAEQDEGETSFFFFLCGSLRALRLCVEGFLIP